MSFVIRPGIVTCIFICLLVSPCKAQKLASNKRLNEIYNKKTNEKVGEINKSRRSYKPKEQKQNLPSMQSSLRDVANLKMKNTGIHPHYNSNLTIEEKKSRLPGNSPKLNQLGKPVTKSRTPLIK